MSILVSINCITYNHEKYIADAIESFLMQKTNFNFEILIGEDCSTDGTKKIVDLYAKKYPGKIQMITSTQNVGARKNSQRLIDNSKGKYIAECEGDDYWIDPYKLQKQVDYLEDNPGCTLCFHAAEVVQAPKKATSRKIKPYRTNRISPLEDFITGGGGFCHTASLVYPRTLMMTPAVFHQTAHAGDYAMQLYLASQGYAYYLDDCMSAYRIGVEGSWTNRMYSKGNQKENMITVYEGDIKLLQGFNAYTKSSFSSEVENMIGKREFAIMILKRRFMRPQSTKREYIDELGAKEKLKIYALCSFPKIYVKLADIRSFIVNNKLFS